MKNRFVRVSMIIATSLLVACGFIRSFDGFSDDFGKEDAAGNDAGDAGFDARVDDDGAVDAGIGCNPPEVMWTGGAKNLNGPYLYGMAQDEASLYVVGGTYNNDAAAADAGFAMRIDKSPPFNVSYPATSIDQPTAITTTSYGIYYSARGTIYRIDDNGGPPTVVKTLAPVNTTNTITDLTGDDAGLYFTTGLGNAAARLNFLAGGNFATMASRPYVNAWRVRTDRDSVYVTRRAGDAGPGLARFDRDAALEDAAVPSCVVDDQVVLDVSTNGERIGWGSVGPTLQNAIETVCDPPVRTVEAAPPVAVAVGERFMFARYPGSVALYTFSGEKVSGCTYALVSNDEGILSAKATQSAFFDGDVVYFQTPQRVYRMRITAR